MQAEKPTHFAAQPKAPAKLGKFGPKASASAAPVETSDQAMPIKQQFNVYVSFDWMKTKATATRDDTRMPTPSSPE